MKINKHTVGKTKQKKKKNSKIENKNKNVWKMNVCCKSKCQ